MGAFLLMTMDDGKALEVDVVTVVQHWECTSCTLYCVHLNMVKVVNLFYFFYFDIHEGHYVY